MLDILKDKHFLQKKQPARSRPVPIPEHLLCTTESRRTAVKVES